MPSFQPACSVVVPSAPWSETCPLVLSGVSHSVMSDMHMIQQEAPGGVKAPKPRRYIEEEDDEGSFSPR